MPDDAKKQNRILKPSEKPASKLRAATAKLREEIEGKKNREKDVKKGTTEQTSDIKREILEDEVGPDRETVEKILSIDPLKAIAEQPEAYKRFELAIHTLIPKILDGVASKEHLLDLTRISEIQVTDKMNATEKIALDKIKKTVSQKDALYMDLKMRWSKYVEESSKIYSTSDQVRNVLLGRPSSGKIGKESVKEWIVTQIKEHPLRTALVLGFGAWGIYSLFFKGAAEDSRESLLGKLGLDKKKMLIGVLILLVAGGLIGRESITGLFGNMKDVMALVKEGKYKEALLALKGLKINPDIKPEEKVETDIPTQSPEELKEYGEFAPIGEVTKNLTRELKQQLAPLHAWAVENQEAVAAAGLFAASFDGLRNGAVGLGGLSFDACVGLAKVPFKVVGEFPLTSLFTVLAALIAHDRFQIKDAMGNIMVPKDPENLKKYISKKLEDAHEWAHDLPPVPRHHVDQAVDIIQQPHLLEKYIGPVEKMIERIGVGALEMAALSPREIVRKVNDKGLHVLLISLGNLQLDHEEGSEEHEQYQLLVEVVKKMRIAAAAGQKLSQESMLAELNTAGVTLGISFLLHDGYIAWVKKDLNSGLIKIGPTNIIIDPSLDEDDAVNMARRFATEDSIYNALGRGVSVPIEQLRMLLDETLFEEIKSIEDANRIVDKKIRSGGYIALYGAKAWLYESVGGVMHRYVLGPVNVFKHVFKGLTGDFSYVEAAVDYSQGLLPVLIMGMTANILRGDFQNVFSKKLLIESAAYPLKGLYDMGSVGFRHVLPNLGSVEGMKKIVKDPAMKFHSDFWSTIYNVKRFSSSISTLSYRSTVAAEYGDLAKLHQAKRHLYESKFNLISKGDALDQAETVLTRIDGIEASKLRDDNVDEFLKKIDDVIKEREGILKKINEFEAHSKALEYHKQGKGEKAKALLEKIEYKGEITKKALERKIQELKNEVKEKRPQIVLETLTKTEQDEIIKNFKDAKPDIEKLRDEGAAAIRAEQERMTNEGIPVISAEWERREMEISSQYDKKFAELFQAKKIQGLDLVDDATLRANDLDPVKIREELPKLETKLRAETGHARLKSAGKGLLGFAAGLLAIYGISKGIEFFQSEEKGFNLEKLEANESPEQKRKRQENKENLKNDPESHNKALEEIQSYFTSMESDYRELNEIIGDPKKLKETSDEKLIEIVDRVSKKHEENVEKLKKFVGVNRDAIMLYYDRLPEEKDGKDRSLGQFFSIGFDEDDKKPYLKYADEGDFREAYYEIVDFYKAHVDQLLRGEKVTGFDQVTYAGKYIVPVMGVWYDGVDTYNAIKRGEVMSAIKSGGWTVFGAISDGLLVAAPFTAGISGALSGGMKAARIGATGAKAAGTVARLTKVAATIEKVQKAVEAAHVAVKASKIGKYAHTVGAIGMGADLGRQIFDPPKSQKYYL